MRAVIEQAAVLGETFDLPALISTCETEVGATLAAIDSAEAVGLVRAVHDSDGEFAFVHALTRESVLGGMAASRLRVMHARAAEALEGRADPSLVPRLANHFLVAHVLGYHEQALRYARQAARMAEQSLAYEDAAKWYERAASLPELTLADRSRLHLDAAANHVRGASFARAREIYERIGAMDDPLMLLEAAVGYEDANWRPGQAEFEGGRLAGVGAGIVRAASRRPALCAGARQLRPSAGIRGRGGAGPRNRRRRRSSARVPSTIAAVLLHTSEDEPVARPHPGDERGPGGACRPRYRGWRYRAATTSHWARHHTSMPWSATWPAGPTALAAVDRRHAASGPSLRTTLLRLRRVVHGAGAGLPARRLRRCRTMGRHRLAHGRSVRRR